MASSRIFERGEVLYVNPADTEGVSEAVTYKKNGYIDPWHSRMFRPIGIGIEH